MALVRLGIRRGDAQTAPEISANYSPQGVTMDRHTATGNRHTVGEGVSSPASTVTGSGKKRRRHAAKHSVSR